jgi:hypothetical protein
MNLICLKNGAKEQLFFLTTDFFRVKIRSEARLRIFVISRLQLV